MPVWTRCVDDPALRTFVNVEAFTETSGRVFLPFHSIIPVWPSELRAPSSEAIAVLEVMSVLLTDKRDSLKPMRLVGWGNGPIISIVTDGPITILTDSAHRKVVSGLLTLFEMNVLDGFHQFYCSSILQ